MNLRFVIVICCWNMVWAETPIILLKDGTENLPSSDLNDTPKSAETNQNKVVKTKAQSDSIDSYTSGLTPQFRNLLLAPDSRENQQLKKPVKEVEEKAETVYPTYRTDYEGLPQAHVDQLLRYYGKIAGKLLPQGYAKFRKITTENEKNRDKQEEEPETKEAPTVEVTNPEPKVAPVSEHVVNTAVNAAIANVALAALQGASAASLPGYGTLNYLNAANYLPPTPQNAYATALRNRLYASNYLTNSNNGYGLQGGCCNYCPPCNTQQPVYENSCSGLQNANALQAGQGMGCSGTEYANTDTDNDEYGPDNYFQSAGGYGTSLSSRENRNTAQNTQLLSGYAPQTPSPTSNPSYGSSKQQPGSYYQVSSPISSPFLVDAHPYSPVGSLFATSHMHHFGPYSASSNSNNNPFQQYYGTLNAYPSNQRFNYGTNTMGESDGSYGYSSGPFGPMFDYSPTSSNTESETTTNVPKNIIISANPTKTPTDQKQIENIFHIVKPNFSSLKKVAIMKKHRNSNISSKSTTQKPETTTILSTTTTSQMPKTTTKSLVGRKMSKIIQARKSSTPSPKTTTTLGAKMSKTVIESSTGSSSPKTTTLVTSTNGGNNSTKKIRFS